MGLIGLPEDMSCCVVCRVSCVVCRAVLRRALYVVSPASLRSEFEVIQHFQQLQFALEPTGDATRGATSCPSRPSLGLALGRPDEILAASRLSPRRTQVQNSRNCSVRLAALPLLLTAGYSCAHTLCAALPSTARGHNGGVAGHHLVTSSVSCVGPRPQLDRTGTGLD